MDLSLSRLPDPEEFERKASEVHVSCMASGEIGDQFKFYFFGRDNMDKLYLAEVLLKKENAHFSAVIKAEDSTKADAFASVFMDAIASYL